MPFLPLHAPLPPRTPLSLLRSAPPYKHTVHVQPYNVNVNAICPGATRTGRFMHNAKKGAQVRPTWSLEAVEGGKRGGGQTQAGGGGGGKGGRDLSAACCCPMATCLPVLPPCGHSARFLARSSSALSLSLGCSAQELLAHARLFSL